MVMQTNPAPASAPATPVPPPTFGDNMKQKKPQVRSMQPTFLGQEQTNPTNTGQKTLLGT